MKFGREEILAQLRSNIDAGNPIIGAGAGTGISAKCEAAGGIDMIIIYNSGRFRMAGRGSLAGMMPYGDANQIVIDMASEVLPVVPDTPVLAGVCGTDPFRLMDVFLKQVDAVGFSGVQNFPTVGLIDGTFRQLLEETDMGYGPEVEMIRTASQMGMLTTPYAFNETEAEQMADAGADILVAHMGLPNVFRQNVQSPHRSRNSTKGSIGAQTSLTLEDAAERVQAIHDAAKGVNPEILVICHGGGSQTTGSDKRDIAVACFIEIFSIAEPEDATYVLENTEGVVGFYGASSAERLPTERAEASS